MAKLGKVVTESQEKEVKTNKSLPNEVTIEDVQGRKIVVAKPPYIRRLRLLAAVGDTLSSNKAYMNEISLINWVKSIDGIAVFEASTMAEIEGIVNRLEDDGFTAILQGIMEITGIKIDSDEQEEVDPLTKK